MYDLIILGSGPAGLSASIYASRYNVKHLVISKEPGGYLNEIHKVENYPGFVEISGMELGQKMTEHAETFNSKIVREIVLDVEKLEDGFKVKTDKNSYEARKVIYAIGTSCKKLHIPGEEEFLGKGVSYCATCDGPFFKGKEVFVVGGGNSAAMAALMLAEHAKKVTIIYRKDKLRCAPSYIDRINKKENINVLFGTTLKRVMGKDRIEEVLLCNPPHTDRNEKADGVFIEIGSTPNCEIILNLGIEVDEKGFIKVNPDQSTNIPNFYAAGDITTNSNGFRQIITAASEGAIAALAVFEGLNQK